MRKPLTYVICVAFAFLLFTPALASAATSTADQIAALQKAVTALQTLTAQQGQQIQTLQCQVAAKHTILSGVVAPAASLGCVGDLYVNSFSYQIYGPKTCSSWGSPTSLIGPRGATGATGLTGATGATGPAGLQGPKGDTGAAGAIGQVGPQGSKGDKGATGATGPQGAKGDAGAMGPAGPAGHDGLDGAVGLQGPKGEKGDTGATGDTGAQGPKGDTGEAGAAGTAGATWYADSGIPTAALGSDGDFYLDKTAAEVYQKMDGNWAAVAGLVGPQGAKGAMGEAGPAGPAGADGASGPKGDTGATGATGDVGQQGPKGDTGATGPSGDASSLLAEYPGLFALAQYVRVETGAVNGDSGPNIVVSGANLFTENDLGVYSLIGGLYSPVPAAPASLSATLQDEGSGSTIEWHAALSWPASSTADVAGYRIYCRDVSGSTTGSWTKLADVGATDTSYDDGPLVIGRSYQYGVTSLGKQSETAITESTKREVTGVATCQVIATQPFTTQTGTFQVVALDKNGDTVTTFHGVVRTTYALPGVRFNLYPTPTNAVNGEADLWVVKLISGSPYSESVKLDLFDAHNNLVTSCSSSLQWAPYL